MKFETKYELGQTVCLLQKAEHYRIVNCITCAQSGKVSIGAEEFVCPACQGRSARRLFAGWKWYIDYDNAVIGKIQIELVIGEEWRRSSHGRRPECAYSTGTEYTVSYMVDVTGIGSGTVWREENIFTSKAEAAEECLRRNSLLESDDPDAHMKPEAA
jgi:hypothetical protein